MNAYRFAILLTAGLSTAGFWSATAAAQDTCSSGCCMSCCGREYKLIYQTKYEQRQVTSYRLEYETAYEDRRETRYRPVYETQLHERRYVLAGNRRKRAISRTSPCVVSDESAFESRIGTFGQTCRDCRPRSVPSCANWSRRGRRKIVCGTLAAHEAPVRSREK